MKRFDLAVVGAGPGGYVAAIHGAQKGFRVALIEKDKVGGTCLQRGCIPTKALLEAAERFDALRSASRFGIMVEGAAFDYGKVVGRKDRVVMRLTKGIEKLLQDNGVELLAGEGRFLDAHTLEVGGDAIWAERVLIATGSQPVRLPGFEGAKCWTSDELLAAKERPESLTILGGGVIGVEFASLFAMLGTKVTILELMPALVPGMDGDLSRMLAESLRKRGVKIYLETRALRADGESITILRDGVEEVLPLDTLLMAIGRKPFAQGLEAEAAGVAMERGAVPVNGFMQSNVPHIYAIGDVTGQSSLAHAASAQAVVAVEHMAGGQGVWDGRFVPACVYTSPEIASVGWTKAQAEAAGHRVRVGEFPVAINGKSMIAEEGAGLVRLVFDQGDGRLLGAHMMAPRATDMIGELCLALELGAKASDLAETVHPHPTFVEMVMEAAMDAEGGSPHLPPKAK